MPELDIQGILARLGAAAVDYLVIGGVAVGFHGYVRATKDLNIVPSPDRRNLERLAGVLRELNAELDGAGDFDAEEIPDPLDPAILAGSEGRRLRGPCRVEGAGGPPFRPGGSAATSRGPRGMSRVAIRARCFS